MQHLIRFTDLKLARADVQVGKIVDEISAWTSRHPITVRSELRDNRLGYRLVVDDFAETAPLDKWGLLIGECVHNLRSALDNLAFALARLRQDPPSKPSEVHFPIHRDELGFERNTKVRSSLEQMPDKAASLIEQLQPFQRNRPEVEGTPETDALVLLQWLNNTDKHRVPSVVQVAPQTIEASGEMEFYSDEDAQANRPEARGFYGPLEAGMILFECKTTRPVSKVKGKFQVGGIVAMETGHGRLPVDITLRDLLYYTAQIVELFRHFFT